VIGRCLTLALGLLGALVLAVLGNALLHEVAAALARCLH
jgi:hypothetical protein